MSKNALWIAATGLAYILGAATAVLVMRESLDRKHRKRADLEIESVVEAFRRKEEAWKVELEQKAAMNEEDKEKLDAKGRITNLSEHSVKVPNTEATESAAGLMSKEDKEKLDAVYSGLIANKPKPSENEDAENVVYISPDEFEDNEEYDVALITYYEGDCVFTDYMDEPIPDAEWEDMLGPNVAKHFGDYEPDRVCVRNDKRRTYYEVVREEGEFTE